MRHRLARQDLDAGDIPDPTAEPTESGLLAAERHAALREAFACLSPGCRQLLAMLLEDPPVPYAQGAASFLRSGWLPVWLPGISLATLMIE